MSKHCFICKRTIDCSCNCLECVLEHTEETKEMYNALVDKLRKENDQLHQEKLALERKIANLERNILLAIHDTFKKEAN